LLRTGGTPQHTNFAPGEEKGNTSRGHEGKGEGVTISTYSPGGRRVLEKSKNAMLKIPEWKEEQNRKVEKVILIGAQSRKYKKRSQWQ